MLSYAASRIPFIGCSLGSLRALNVVGVVLLFVLLRQAFLKKATAEGVKHARLFEHASLNVTLFPPLFFFSALYYTDVWSTLLVVTFYATLLDLDNDRHSRTWTSVKLVGIGILSLLFRQTNVFWVTAFPAGLVLVQQLDRGHQAVRDSVYREVEGFGDTWYSIAKTSWKMEVIYDPPVKDCWIDGKSL